MDTELGPVSRNHQPNLPFDPKLQKVILTLLPSSVSLLTVSVKYNHPAHGNEFIPTLQSVTVEKSRVLFPQLTHIATDDIHREAWPTFITALADQAQNLKILNIEACSEKDPFMSTRGLATVFPSLKKLECIRLDGCPIGSSDFHWGGDMDIFVLSTFCPNLRAVSLDYCDLTLSTFYTLWNNCPNIDFLAFAGLQDITGKRIRLEPRPKLQTLRFVDCQVDDNIVS